MQGGRKIEVNEGVVGIIPSRYHSTRLPGKPLLDIGGKPMIQWVVERALGASLVSRIIVATDDERIFNCVREFGGEVVMTPRNTPSGTDRVACAAKDMEADIVVNIQGDEPFIEPEEVDRVARILMEDENAVMGTLVTRFTDAEELEDPNNVKVVVDEKGNALYFSRSPIPFNRGKKDTRDWLEGHTYYKHVGIYSYRREFLLRYVGWKPTLLEKAERLEQLRALEKGYRIKVAESIFSSVCVDTPKDLERVRSYWEEGKMLNAERR